MMSTYDRRAVRMKLFCLSANREHGIRTCVTFALASASRASCFSKPSRAPVQISWLRRGAALFSPHWGGQLSSRRKFPGHLDNLRRIHLGPRGIDLRGDEIIEKGRARGNAGRTATRGATGKRVGGRRSSWKRGRPIDRPPPIPLRNFPGFHLQGHPLEFPPGTRETDGKQAGKRRACQTPAKKRNMGPL